MSHSAVEYAHQAEEWSALDWWHLEARAVARHPDLTHALAFFAPPAAWTQLSRGVPKALGCLMVPAHIASLTLPVSAAVMMTAWLGETEATAPVAVAGAFAGFAAAWSLFGMSRDARSPDGRAVNGARLLALLHLLPSSIATVLALLAIGHGVAIGAVGIVGLLADVAYGIAALRFYVPTSDSAATEQLNLRRLNRAVEALDHHARLEILADLHHAIDVLEQRALIDADLARAARNQPVASLARTMAPRERVKP
ncbi:hypothetical protein [Ruania halotolerans]|uniref:hypothetical protein n=1 Tax=Ruania halotolerans TaxID=2897773 RepID=UPI001E2B4470|nr:hypothetical protein [Ruania halotolerans]UFU08067.1 hypothetical protein LQF10_08205 [Ruania halotolerans]